ncbi:class I SAM-dependent methyltransferase (plasmid) [Bacillus sp. 31A1R]|uniref:Class I SAM-dependent methyltransferase n=1 Tax=Robertmurraya mangrovi TaxID=3098077 RepID=A0ABU5IUT4_9BACI|nr:class I SAM-dependent methyltransferase [Bacillus sp. 31A1R]MDZ5470914.1 class I SAM-dependent methyltransferase [Bacillus sp. 31A1R]
MTYGKFAYLYDDLMEEVPYDRWVEMVLKLKSKYNLKGDKLLDLACGTGELSVSLTGAGFDVIGVDLSGDMLAVANEKAENSGNQIPLYQQNMVELDVNTTFDIIGIFCDSLNYLQSEEEVIETFHKVLQHLDSGGLFIFDVHSVYKIMEVFMNQTFTHDQEDICYIWNCFQGEYPYSVEHELTFFVQDSNTNKYDRYDEFHSQRTFPVNQYQSWLSEAGFEFLEMTADFTDDSPTNDSERIFFVARKP